MSAARTRWLAALALISSAFTPCHAEPWLAPGNESLRNDIQLLADAGVLRGPTTTWPLSWPDIARDVHGAEPEKLDQITADALLRVQRVARVAAANGFSGIGIRAAGAHEPVRLRGFADTPREEAELGAQASWLTEHFAVNLAATVVADPDDGKQLRADGSYLGVNVGNFMISAGYMERWWGPGWEGSLILSTNARPIPSLTLERNYTDPFKTPLLSWLGPWRASIALGRMESHGLEVPGVRFMAARANFRPRPWLEIGLTRTAQWCGGERDCGWQTFRDMLIGRDNQVVDGSVDTQPGNQMAGYDLRLRSPWKRLPLAFYGQLIGEDEAGGLPAKFLGLGGVEFWTGTSLGALRMHLEYADTTCSFSRQEPLFNCAYRNGIYPQGYAYRGRIIGHSMDNDSRMLSLGAILSFTGGDVLSATVERVNLNRDGQEVHAWTATPLDLDNVELRYSRGLGPGRLTIQLGHEQGGAADSATGFRGSLSWQQGF